MSATRYGKTDHHEGWTIEECAHAVRYETWSGVVVHDLAVALRKALNELAALKTEVALAATMMAPAGVEPPPGEFVGPIPIVDLTHDLLDRAHAQIDAKDGQIAALKEHADLFRRQLSEALNQGDGSYRP